VCRRETSFPITLTCGATVLNANATTATPAVFTRLPPGNCTVAEGTLPTIAGVTWGTPTYDPSATVTVTSGANAAVTVTNTASVTTYAITATPVPTAGGTVSLHAEPGRSRRHQHLRRHGQRRLHLRQLERRLHGQRRLHAEQRHRDQDGDGGFHPQDIYWSHRHQHG
jgi:hypothetical protein